MSLPITEVVVLALQSGASPGEASNGLSLILRRQAGFQRFLWGQWKERKDKIQLLIGKSPNPYLQNDQTRFSLTISPRL